VLFYRLTFSCLGIITFAFLTGLPAWSLKSQTASMAPAEPASEPGERRKENSLHVIDLTHPISTSTPTWDGHSGEYHYQKLDSIAKDGFFAGAFNMPEHFGTHMDAPAHFIDGAATIDKLPPERLILPAVVIDVREEVAKNPDYQVTVEKLEDWESRGRITPGCAVLLLTGWDKRYSDAHSYRNPDANGHMHFPGFSTEAGKYLVEDRRVAALGIDTLSIDPGKTEIFPVHKVALAHDVFLIENLKDLELLPARGILLFCGALPIQGGSGSPARILAIVD
jgi:kynurenine formamidase